MTIIVKTLSISNQERIRPGQRRSGHREPDQAAYRGDQARGVAAAQLELQTEGFSGRLMEISKFLKKEGNAWLAANGQGHSPWEELPYWLKGYGDMGYVLGDKKIIDDKTTAILSSDSELLRILMRGEAGANEHERTANALVRARAAAGAPLGPAPDCTPAGRALAAERHLRKVNSSIEIEGIVADANYTNIEKFCHDADVILDGLDNTETRLLINDVALKHKIPWVYGGAIASSGMTMTIIPGELTELPQPRDICAFSLLVANSLKTFSAYNNIRCSNITYNAEKTA
jgi:hypothetical protein